MKIQTKQLKPGMVLLENALGKSGKPLMEERTELTEKHSVFLSKFRVPDVSVVPLPGQSHNEQTFKEVKNESKFAETYEHIVKYYQRAFRNIENHLPLNNLFEIRRKFIPFFETV